MEATNENILFTALPEAKFAVDAKHDIFNTFATREAENEKQQQLWEKVKNVARNIFSVIIFPVGIYRLLVALARVVTPMVVLPAASIYDCKTEGLSELDKNKLSLIDIRREAFLANANFNAEQITVQTADKVNLDSVTIQNMNQKDLPAKDQKWIVFFTGNADCYENNLMGLSQLVRDSGSNVMCGNYRGVFRSEGKATCSQDLILDGEAMVQYLLSKGVEPQNILLRGWSLGGAVATAVAAQHQEEGKEMNLCVDRSFSTIGDVARGWVGSVLGFAADKLSSAANWGFDSVRDFQKVKGYKFIIQARHDKVIRYSASLYKRLKEANMSPEDLQRKQMRQKLEKNKKPLYPEDYKPSPYIKVTPKDVESDVSDPNLGIMLHCTPLENIGGKVYALFLSHTRKALALA